MPPGLGLSSTGLISGTPSSAGTFNFTVRAQFAIGEPFGTKAFSITIQPAPVIISSSSLPDGTQGVAYSQSLSASGGVPGYTWLLTGGSLPAGVGLSSSGAVSGTPTANGTFNFTAKVTDSLGANSSKGFTLLIKPPPSPLTITTTSLADGTQGVAYSASLGATGGTPGYTWLLIGGSLPSGVGLSSSGSVSGTPTANGTFNFSAQVTDSLGAATSKGFSLLIKPPPSPLTITTTSLADGTQNVAYSASLAATGGTPGYTWSLAGGSLPSGVGLSAAGAVSGTPTANGSFSFTAQVADSLGATTSKGFTLLIKPAPVTLTITTSSLADGTQGVAYSASLGAAGGTPEYTWSLAGGSLPSGVGLSSSGTIGGTPTANGSFSFTAQVADSLGATTSKGFTLLIKPAPVTLTITTSSLPDGTQGVNYSTSLAATGGTPGYIWSLTGGSLPAGVGLSSSGIISGPPTANGSFGFTAQVADSLGATTSKDFTLLIKPATGALTITTTSLPDGTQGVAYSASLASTGGTPEYTWSLIGGSLPAGVGLSASGSVSGTPTANGTFNFTAQVADSAGAKTSKGFTLQIKPLSGPLTITTPSLPDGAQLTSYNQALAASGGTPGYTWLVTEGSLPPGVFLSAAGFLSGTPTTNGSFDFTVQVTDSVAAKASRSFTLVIKITPGPLNISTSSLPDGTQGVPYSYALAASGGAPEYTWSQTGGALPTGITLSPGGLLSGTPAVNGSFNFTVQVSDSLAAKTSKNFALSIKAGAVTLTITTSAVPEAAQGTSYNQALAAAGGKPEYTWSLTGGALPPGVTLSPAGILSGTPSANGSFNFTAQVADSLGATAARSFTLLVQTSGPLKITTTSLADGIPGAGYTQTLTAVGGAPGPIIWSIIGALPPGIALDGTSGVLSGKPLQPGAQTFTVQAKDSAGSVAQTTLSINIKSSSLSIDSPAVLPFALLSKPYSYQLAASGGQPAYTWSQVSGSLPGGVILNASGVISGTPTEAGEFRFRLRVADAAAPPGPNQVSLEFRLTVVPGAIGIVTESLPDTQVGGYYQLTLAAKGGKPPYVWAISSGTLPAGLSFNPDIGTISGTPSGSGSYSFTVKVTDAFGTSDSRTFTLTVRPAADLILSEYAHSFVGFAGGSRPAPVTNSVISSKYLLVPFRVQTEGVVPWLSLSTSGGTTPGRFEVRVDQSALAPGSYRANILVTSDQAAQTISVPVKFDVLGHAAALEVSPGLVEVSVDTAVTRTSRNILVRSSGGGGPITFRAFVREGNAWLSVTPQSGTVDAGAETFVQAVIDRSGLSPGFNRGVITVAYANREVDIPVVANLSVLGTPFWLYPSGLLFVARAGNGASGGVKSFEIHDGGSAAFTVENLDSAKWLSVHANDPTEPGEPGIVDVSVEAHNLRPGVYYGRIRVSASGLVNSPQDLVVVLQVVDASVPPVPEPVPAGLLFVGFSGTPVPSRTTRLYTSSDTPLAYQAAPATDDGKTWLNVTPATGLTSTVRPANLAIAADFTSLKPGVYRGVANLSLSSTDVRSVNVTALVLTPRPSQLAAASGAGPALAGCTPANLVPTHTGMTANFSSPAGWPTPMSVRVVDNCGDPVISGSVVARFSNGDPSLVLRLSNPKEGTYSGTWVPTNSAAQVNVSANVNAPGFPPTQIELIGKVPANRAPALAKNGTLNNFNPVLGAPLAPGTVVQIFGTDLAPGDAAAGLPLPVVLNGTSVIVKGIPAPLFFVSSGQINAQLPVELDPLNTEQQVIVTVNGAFTQPDSVRLTKVQPGIANFGDGRLIAQRPDYTLVSPENPAHPGEFLVVYLTGMGPTDPISATGDVSPLSPLANAVVAPTVTVAGRPAEIFFAGLTPGFVGLYQINLRIPADAPADEKAELVVSQGGVVSNTTVLPITPAK